MLIFCVIATLLLPQISQLFIDSIYTTTNTDTGNLGVIWYFLIGKLGDLDTTNLVLILSITFIVVAIIKNLFSYGATQMFFKSASDSCGDLRKDCFKKLAFADKNISINQTFFNFTTDIDDYYETVNTYTPRIFENGLKVLIALVLLYIINFVVAIPVTIITIIMFLVAFVIKYKLITKFSEARNRKSNMIEASEEIIENIREVKLNNKETWAVEAYDSFNNLHTKSIVQSNNFVNRHKIWLNLLRVLGLGTALVVSVLMTIRGIISIGYLVLIMSYAFIIFDGTINIFNNYYDAKIASIGVGKLNKLLNIKTRIKEKNKEITTYPEIRFLNVKLDLNEKEIFKDLSFRLPYGKHYLLQINQGKGKTALARLLLRFVSHSSGKIYINDKPYENYSITSLRKQFSYVPQEPIIFEGPLVENITMFAAVNKEKLEKVLKICGLNNIRSLDPQNLTQQEKQKIVLARALYRDAPILLMDNCFTKFSDSESLRLMRIIQKCYKDKTIIFLSTNIQFKEFFDNIIKIQDGGVK